MIHASRLSREWPVAISATPQDLKTKVLANLNPNATPGSMARWAAINCIVAAIRYGAEAVFHFNPKAQPWWMGFAAFVGAVCEWQDTPD